MLKVGSIVEIDEKLASRFKVEDCVGVLFKISPYDFFPYKIRIKALTDISIPCTEDEFELTNKPLCQELVEWRRKHISHERYIEYPD